MEGFESQIADISLAEWGRKEMDLAEVEMPGLMQCRKEYPGVLKGARISGSLHMTIQTAVLIETLQALGAEVRWASCNIFSTQDHAASAIVAAKTANVFAWKGETIDEYWRCTEKMLTWPGGKGPDVIVDDGGDATLLIHEGAKWERTFSKTGELPAPEKVEGNVELQAVLTIIKEGLERGEKDKWTQMAANCHGISEETTTGVHRLHQMSEKGELLIPCINVNDAVTKSKFDNIYGCRHSLPDGIMRATDVLISGKKVVICGFGDVGKGCASSMKAQGARVCVIEVDPICALQACMEGYSVVRMEEVVEDADIFITATGCMGIITAAHMAKMKNNAIVGNIGHFDIEIDMAGIENDPQVKKTNIKPQLDKFTWADGHSVLVLAEGRLLNLGCATGHPSFVMSTSFSNQTIAQIELWQNRNTNKYERGKVYVIPKILDEKVARLHLEALGAHLTELSTEQADYLGIPKEGPYKPDTYRY